MKKINNIDDSNLVAVIDGKHMSLPDAVITLRKENKELKEERDKAVKLVHMFIRRFDYCHLCARVDCNFRDKKGFYSVCTPSWNGEEDSDVD